MRAALDCPKAAQCKVQWGLVVSLTHPCSLQPTREKLGKEPSECKEEELESILVRAKYHWNGHPWQTNIAWVHAGKISQCWHSGTHRQGTWWRAKAKHTLPSSAVWVWAYYYHVPSPTPREYLLSATLSQGFQSPSGNTSATLTCHACCSLE